jgi:hypothetical protein
LSISPFNPVTFGPPHTLQFCCWCMHS